MLFLRFLQSYEGVNDGCSGSARGRSAGSERPRLVLSVLTGKAGLLDQVYGDAAVDDAEPPAHDGRAGTSDNRCLGKSTYFAFSFRSRSLMKLIIRSLGSSPLEENPVAADL